MKTRESRTLKTSISTTKAPGAIGPYSQAVRIGDMLFASGQLGLHPETGAFGQTVEEQTAQALDNVRAILEEAGLDFANVVKTTIFLKDMNDFPKVNDIYRTYFSEPYPARSTVEVARLPKDGLVEIEVIAVKN
jgi:2-iminobutanoate/2-iminopropanoate deaminase